MRSRRLVFRGGRRWLGGRLWGRRRRRLLREHEVDEDVDGCELSAMELGLRRAGVVLKRGREVSVGR